MLQNFHALFRNRDAMKKDIIVAGVGGQGILLISHIISNAAMHENLFVKQSFIKGLSQRRGEVFSQIRISDENVYSPIIPPCNVDLLIGLEPLEAARFVHNLSPDGHAIVNTEKIEIKNYPELDDYFPQERCHFIDAKKIADAVGLAKAENMALLGAASTFLPMRNETIMATMNKVVTKFIDKNIQAYELGKQEACAKKSADF